METNRVKEAVLYALQTNNDSRNSNELLCAMVYEYLGLPTDLKELSRVNNKPSVETITRMRRKWVEKYPYLKGNEKVEHYRKEKILDYKKIAYERG